MDCSIRSGYLSDSRSDWSFDIIPVQGQMAKGDEGIGPFPVSRLGEESYIPRPSSWPCGAWVIDRVHFTTRQESYAMEATASEHAPTKRSRMLFPSLSLSVLLIPSHLANNNLTCPDRFDRFDRFLNQEKIVRIASPRNSSSTGNGHSKLARLKPPLYSALSRIEIRTRDLAHDRRRPLVPSDKTMPQWPHPHHGSAVAFRLQKPAPPPLLVESSNIVQVKTRSLKHEERKPIAH